MGGYNVSYTEEQKFAIMVLCYAAYTMDGKGDQSFLGNIILESITEYLDIRNNYSDKYIAEYLSNSPDKIIYPLLDLTDEQKDFLLVILNLVTVGDNIGNKTAYVLGICDIIGIKEKEFNNKLEKLNLLMKKALQDFVW